MRAHVGAIILCGLLLVACASDGARQPLVHPKARKGIPPNWEQQVSQPPEVIAKVEPPPLVQPREAPQPATVPEIAPAPVPRSLPVPATVVAPIAKTAPLRPQQPQPPEKPTWNLPPSTPAMARPPIATQRPVLPVPLLVPVPVPPKNTPTIPVATNSATVVIATAMSAPESRLPCNRSGTNQSTNPYCDLRIYQVNVGTFVDGSPDYNPVAGFGPGPHTGDIEGVTGALDHIKALGFNSVWLTPIFESAAGQPQARIGGSGETNTRLDGTGYFPRDYFKIDPQFGTIEQARTLVDKAHSLGLKVMFDGVFGHHKGGVVASPTGLRPVDATSLDVYGGAPQSYPGAIVDFNDPRSTAFYKEVARYWIDTLGIDGWRLDQVYQIPQVPLREITAEITTASNAQLLSGYVVGEMWGTAAQIRSVLGPSSAPALPSAFDFPTRYALVQTLAGDGDGNQDKPASTINAQWAFGAHKTYPDHAIMNLMLGNHDLVRFGDLIERAGKGGPNTPGYWARHRMAFTFMAAWSGPITIYYGEEVGADVAEFAAKVSGDCARINRCDDHVARNMVAIGGVNARAGASSPQSRALTAYLTSLMTLRAATPALSSGARTHVYSDTDLYVDLKTSGTDKYLLVMNIGSHQRVARLLPPAMGLTQFHSAQVLAGDVVTQNESNALRLTLAPLSASIIRLEGR